MQAMWIKAGRDHSSSSPRVPGPTCPVSSPWLRGTRATSQEVGGQNPQHGAQRRHLVKFQTRQMLAPAFRVIVFKIVGDSICFTCQGLEFGHAL